MQPTVTHEQQQEEDEPDLVDAVGSCDGEVVCHLIELANGRGSKRLGKVNALTVDGLQCQKDYIKYITYHIGSSIHQAMLVYVQTLQYCPNLST